MAYKVIVADDEPIMRKAMSSLIHWEKIGCELVCLAENGFEVMQQLKTLNPDILILDIQMPGKSGIEIAQYISQNKIPVKVILLTAFADFSYAQSAVKYGVIDYVIKTGTMDAIIAAVEKAKAQIEEERMKMCLESMQPLQENFLKAVFDGSLYESEEIREQAEKLCINLQKGMLAIVIRFRMTDMKRQGEHRTYKSLLNFLGMVFGKWMIHGFAIKKCTLVVVLYDIGENYEQEISRKGSQVIDMMENFMGLKVSIGVGNPVKEVTDLKETYSKAEYAVWKCFFDESSRIEFYSKCHTVDKSFVRDADKQQEDLCYAIKRGASEEALELFSNLLEAQYNAGEPVDVILNSGISIRNYCRKLMMEYEKTMYDVTPYESSISEMINQCMHVSEYRPIMETIIRATSDYLKIAVSGKNMLIQECERYIHNNYDKCITVADVARSIGTSPSYLSRIFKDETGDTIIHTINQKKIEKAKEYLDITNMKIYEIAVKLGFENITYFSRFFKKYTGISPKEYRDEKR